MTVANLSLSPLANFFWKSVNIWGSYGQEFGVLFFWTNGVESQPYQCRKSKNNTKDNKSHIIMYLTSKNWNASHTITNWHNQSSQHSQHKWHSFTAVTPAKNQLDLSSHFNTIPAADRQTDKQQHAIWCDTRCYFNVRSKANMSQLNLPHGTDN